ncbi:MAG: sulfatase [Chloroflexi bacterium]|nr:sulfatase [Chloroflexota bacterium]
MNWDRGVCYERQPDVVWVRHLTAAKEESILRPNIVFAFADDWGRYASAYRRFENDRSINQLIETPNFDRIASEGAIFKNAHVPAPTCTPCRSSLLSGRYFWQTGMGAILQGARWDENIPSYPLLLEDSGYHIGYTYKVWSPGLAVNAPYGGARTAYESAGTLFNNFSINSTEMISAQGIDGAKQVMLDETGRNFESFLNARPDDTPFCYWWGPTNTHRAWERGSGKALWGLDPDDLKGRLPAFLPDVPEVREDVNDYLGECLAFDAGLGVLLDRLEADGELENTMIVVSGDHGIPGFPRAKCNLYDIGTQVALAVRWPGHVQAGRVIDDFVNLMDIAPTFLDAAGVAMPGEIPGRSLVPVLESSESGQIDPKRTFVVTGRERHVARAREGQLPYPQRAIRTRDFLYIHNFEPDRWPMGDPQGLDDLTATAPSSEELIGTYETAFSDLDKGPTKAWMIHHRADPEVEPLFWLGFGKRPLEELYDLRLDPDYMTNVADDTEYADVRDGLREQLMAELRANDDPRVVESPPRFERAPFAGPVPDEWYVENWAGIASLG